MRTMRWLGRWGATARYLAELEAERKGTAEKSTSVRMPEPDLAQQTASASAPSARIYYFHLQPNGLPEEMSDRDGHLVWRAQYRIWGSAVTEEWQTFDAGRAVDATAGEAVIRTLAGRRLLRKTSACRGSTLIGKRGCTTTPSVIMIPISGDSSARTRLGWLGV